MRGGGGGRGGGDRLVSLGYEDLFPSPRFGTVPAPKLPILVSTVHNKLPQQLIKWVRT